MKTHEKAVEYFYSTGLKKIKYNISKQLFKGFLSFGYWNKNTKTYLEAAKNLLEFFIKNSKIIKADRILNVACGYGNETFSYFEEFNPKLIEGIDITKAHIIYANNKAKTLSLDNKIIFYHGNACILNFVDNSFSHIMGIEGPAHFNSREIFFKSASRVLKEKGELLLTDIILGKKFNIRNIIHRIIMKFLSKKWVVPIINWVDEYKYKEQLKKAGLNIIFFKKIGDKVFPGYANNSFSLKTLKIRILERGFIPAIGLTIISYALGFVYKKGLIEYIYFKAQKWNNIYYITHTSDNLGFLGTPRQARRSQNPAHLSYSYRSKEYVLLLRKCFNLLKGWTSGSPIRCATLLDLFMLKY